VGEGRAKEIIVIHAHDCIVEYLPDFCIICRVPDFLYDVDYAMRY
jgi:hypothetical protein